MAFIAVIFELVIAQKGMRGQRNIIDGSTSHIEDIAIGQTDHILLDPRHSRLTLLALHILGRKDLIDGRDNIAKNIISRNNIRVSRIAINNNKLILILIIP